MLQEYQKLANDLSKITNGLQNLKSLQERAVQLQSLINAAGNLGNPQYDGNLADLTSELRDLDGKIAEALASITRIQQRINGMTKVSMPEGFDNLQQHLDTRRDTSALEGKIQYASAVINKMNGLLIATMNNSKPTGSLQELTEKPTGPVKPSVNDAALQADNNNLIARRDGLNGVKDPLSTIIKEKIDGERIKAEANAKLTEGDPSAPKERLASRKPSEIDTKLKENMDALNAERARLEADFEPGTETVAWIG